MSNPYAEVIDLVNSGNIDYRRIAIELAKTQPSLFLRLHKGNVPKVTKAPLLSVSTVCAIRAAIKTEALVMAIKILRQATGLPLKDSKDIIFVAAGREPIDNISTQFDGYIAEIKGC